MLRKGKGQQQEIGNDKAQRKDLCRRQTILKQHLRKYEGAAPDSHYNKGYEMIAQIIAS